MKKVIILLSLTINHWGYGQTAELNRDNQSAISFLPNNGNSIFHISHGLNNDLNISQGGNIGAGNIMTIKNNGFIGIGTLTPASKLDIENGDLYIGKEVSSNGLRRQIRVYGYDNNSQFYGSIHSNYDNSKRTFDISANNKTQQIKIDASANSYANIILKPGDAGNIGIGTMNPTQKISIQGNNNSVSVSQSTYNYSLSTPIGAQFGVWDGSYTNAAGTKFHRYRGSANSFTNAYIGQSQANGEWGLDFRVENQTSATNAIQSRMFIRPNGNVGVGTTLPKSKLEVNGDFTVGNSTRVGSYVNIIGAGSSQSFGLQLGHANNPDGKASILSHTTTGGIYFSVQENQAMFLNSSGNLGIGTTNPDSKLSVKGQIHTSEVKVDLASNVAPDYVFYKDYDLKSLKEVEAYIAIEGHLPNIPSAKEMEVDGIMLKEMNLKLLEKIEELTLYVIDQDKTLELQRREIISLQAKVSIVDTLEKELENQKEINNNLEVRLQRIETILHSKKQ